MKKKKFNSTPFLVIAFFIFLGIYLYPYVSDRWNAYRNKQLIVEYQQMVEISDEDHIDKYDEEYEKAVEYNKELAEMTNKVITKTDEETDAVYEGLLNTNGEGMMGFCEVPKLQLEAPIYHYSTDDILDKGIGHIYGSSLPIGTEGSHSVLSGHRGLPFSKLFTDLDLMEAGDKFYIHVLGHDLAYEVFDIKVVLPDEVDSLVIEPGEDLVTLVTCTPYGVNTHRLLVTGKRCEYDVEIKQEENEKGKTLQREKKITPQNVTVLGLVVFVAVMLISMIISKKKKKGVVK